MEKTIVRIGKSRTGKIRNLLAGGFVLTLLVAGAVPAAPPAPEDYENVYPWNNPANYTVYHVTQLGSSGAGSFRWAVDQANADGVPSKIVFDVGGHIYPGTQETTLQYGNPPKLNADYLFIDGWTAPEPVILEGTESGIVLNSGKHIIRGLVFQYLRYDGITYATGSTGVIKDNVVDYCKFWKCYDEGVSWGGLGGGGTGGDSNHFNNTLARSLVQDCGMYHPDTLEGDGRGIFVTNGAEATIVGNYLYGNLRGIGMNVLESGAHYRNNSVTYCEMTYGMQAEARANIIGNYCHYNNIWDIKITGGTYYQSGNDYGSSSPDPLEGETSEIVLPDTPFPSWATGIALPSSSATVGADYGRPAADAAASVTAGHSPLTVRFTAANPQGNITAYYWDFGDGSTSSQQNSVHTFDGAAVRQVMLETTLASGMKNRDWIEIYVAGAGSPLRQIIRPDGNGDSIAPIPFYTQPTDEPAYQLVNEVYPNERGSFIYNTNAATAGNLFALANPSGVSGASIQSIRVGLRWMRYRNNSNNQVKIAVKTNGSVHYSSYLTAADSDEFQNTYYELTQNPITSQPWTLAELNDLQIGIYSESGIPHGGRVTQMWTEVYYTLPALAGTVSFKYPGWTKTTAPVMYQVRSTGLSPTTPLYEGTLTVTMAPGNPSSGAFTVGDVPGGTYDLALKHANHVADRKADVVVSGGNVTGLILSLWAGDADGDNNFNTVHPTDQKGDNDVDLKDYYTLYYQYLGSKPVTSGYNADFNSDGTVTLLDYNGIKYGYLNKPNPGNWWK